MRFVVGICLILFATASSVIDCGAGVVHKTYWPWGHKLMLTLFQDEMVLQYYDESQPTATGANLWGGCAVAYENLTVVVSSSNNTYTTMADASGYWAITIKEKASTIGTTIEFIGDGDLSKRASLTNVLFGEVWFCSGQSNMEMMVEETFNATEAQQNAVNYPNLRFTDLNSIQPWAAPTSYSIAKFSATCYFAATHTMDIHPKFRTIPLGLVQQSVGGTVIEAWMSPDSLQKCGVSPSPLAQTCSGQNNTVLFTNNILPMANFSFSQILWYQGESNVDCNKNAPNLNYYSCLFPSLITSWRTLFAHNNAEIATEIPFLFVQLAAYGSTDPDSNLRSGDGLPLLRLSQLAALKLPNVGMAAAVDAGDMNQAYTPPSPHHGLIHPRNKTIVGYRLALARLVVDNESPLPPLTPDVLWAPGPKDFHFCLGDTVNVVIDFENSSGLALTETEDCQFAHQMSGDDWLVDEDSSLLPEQTANFRDDEGCCSSLSDSPFEFGLKNGTFVLASATVLSSQVTLTADQIACSDIFSVRYAWQGFPKCLLKNSAALPAISFWYNSTNLAKGIPSALQPSL